ncbi:hypothetical protein FIU95_03680 [Microbulbifer sp. THAF38]|nr:hypothetical protein FIU95_03680 [Microbulbifer sp. THAF38]
MTVLIYCNKRPLSLSILNGGYYLYGDLSESSIFLGFSDCANVLARVCFKLCAKPYRHSIAVFTLKGFMWVLEAAFRRVREPRLIGNEHDLVLIGAKVECGR